MKLPHAEKAVVDIAKLRDYCLNPLHPVGKHKARVFAAVLGLTSVDAELLRDALLQAARIEDVTVGEQDEYGQRYTLDFRLNGPNAQATIRSGWIIRVGENFPRMTTCYVL